MVSGCGAFHATRPASGPDAVCVPAGQWVDPADHRVVPHVRVIERAARAEIVLLGEQHDETEHHRWQLSVLAALLARRSPIVVGFEALPRSAQPALDAWNTGRLDSAALLERTGWQAYWGPGADAYLPIAHWARMHRQSLLALNVSRSLVARVGREGWSAIPPAAREGLGDPVPADQTYRQALAQVYAEHACRDMGSVEGTPEFAHFVEAQLTWDRAMAEALAAAHHDRPNALVVGLMGRGHLERRAGVVRQLAALGVRDVRVLLPWDVERSCAELTPDLASAVFGVAAPADELAEMARARAALTPPCPRPHRESAPERTDDDAARSPSR